MYSINLKYNNSMKLRMAIVIIHNLLQSILNFFAHWTHAKSIYWQILKKKNDEKQKSSEFCLFLKIGVML